MARRPSSYQGAELAAAAEVGDRERSPGRQPRGPAGAEVGEDGDLEAAVAVEERGAGARVAVVGGDEEVRDGGAVGAGRAVSLHGEERREPLGGRREGDGLGGESLTLRPVRLLRRRGRLGDRQRDVEGGGGGGDGAEAHEGLVAQRGGVEGHQGAGREVDGARVGAVEVPVLDAVLGVGTFS